MVHQTVETAGRFSSSITICSTSSQSFSVWSTASSSAKDETDSMFLVREALENRGIRKDSADIIMSGWREGAKKCYHSYIKKWIKHCDGRSKGPFRPTADELIVFLTSLYNQGKGYSCINLARSAVATLSLGSKISVGMHPLV